MSPAFASVAELLHIMDVRLLRQDSALEDTAPGLLAKDAPATWTDHHGRTWRTPMAWGPLPTRTPSSDALREFVFTRDGRRCLWCDATTCLVLDHIISRRNGGAHHPDNLRVLCNACNGMKAAIRDAKGIAA